MGTRRNTIKEENLEIEVFSQALSEAFDISSSTAKNLLKCQRMEPRVIGRDRISPVEHSQRKPNTYDLMN